ncbi:TraB/GumN family protein [Rhizorhapis sp. SPR117]|uniref:TraB/GumN family protein n=1 Tax=Rhizorhapis sp. SPR117 TaxID=2912611 RepID=UPI001F217715|nr:TraB/GumN family protein [Rhizorhapis sp. SPR117]
MKFPVPAFMLAFALALSACASAPVAPVQTVDPASADPALWVVKDEDTSIYLFGTVHVLKPGTVWFDDEIGEAFDKSDKLVTEIIEPEAGSMTAKVASLAIDLDGPPLSEKLDADAKAKYLAAMTTVGIPYQALERYKPWMVGITLAIAPLGKLGYDAELGADKVLNAAAKAAGKSIGALETPEQQLGFFNGLPEDQQIAFLNATVDGLPDVDKDFGELVNDWSAGNPEGLADKMNESLEATPELAETLLFQRNQNWAGQIKTMLDTPGTIFIAVGAGHLAGEKSVQDYLKALGIQATRVPHHE